MVRRRDGKSVVRRIRSSKMRKVGRKRPPRSGKLVTKPKSSSVVKVVRSILSFLPGQTVIQPLADIIFKGMGYSNSVTVSSNERGNTFQGAVNVVGLFSSTIITVKDIVAFASNSVRTEQNEVYNGAEFQTKIDIVRMLNLEVSLRNTTPIGTKTGNWAAWLKLIKHQKQIGDSHGYTYKDLSEMSFATVATAREDIVLRVSQFQPQWKCGRELTLEDVVAILYIGFEDLNRVKYQDFTSEDFSCSGTISSSFIVMSEHPGNYPKKAGYKMQDQLAGYDYLVFSNKGRYEVKSTKVHEHDNKAYVTGIICNESKEEEEEIDMVVV